MKKKLALITCYFQHNYGSQLQALATEMMCRRMGLDYETIRIDGLRSEINRAKYKYFLSKIIDIQTVKDKFATVRKVWAKKTNCDYARNLAIRDGIFDRFAEEQFHLSKTYTSKKELGECARDYSAFIVGSDQLWLPSNIAADYYTLSYVPDDIKKVAYATSFGVANLPRKQAEVARKFLPRFDSIMVREQSGQRLVKELTGKDVPIVCDPTMMFSADEWNELLPTSRRIKEKYILCYFLGDNPWQRKWVKQLAEKTGNKIVQLPNLDNYIKSDEGFADYPLYDVDPLDFVALVRDAEYVLTDSFHCTVFSSLFNKQFFTFRRYSEDGTASTNSRIYSLLASLGATDRLVSVETEVKEAMNLLMYLKSVNANINKLRYDSYTILIEAIPR